MVPVLGNKIEAWSGFTKNSYPDPVLGKAWIRLCFYKKFGSGSSFRRSAYPDPNFILLDPNQPGSATLQPKVYITKKVFEYNARTHGLLGDPEGTANLYCVILRICIGKVAWFAVYICGNFWVTQYVRKQYPQSS